MTEATDTTAGRADVPTVMLDTERVTHDLAARLASSFLAHVLFLKNQIPFPVAQLARMPDKDTRSRAGKKRQQLLNSFDTLASHLYTTFVALSTSLALQHTCIDRDEISRRRDVGKVFLAIVLGPTIGTAKSRLILGIDGFDIKVWGLRDDAIRSSTLTKTAESHVQNDDESEESDDYDSEGEDVETDEADQSSSEDGEEDSSGEEPPPPSRSPSPSPTSSPPPTSPPPPLALPPEHAALPPCHEESNDTVLRSAERLLSFTLARACAEDVHGQGIAAELPPTNIHMLIRAPRRFTHPAWIPRQSFSPTLDHSLATFLEMSVDSKGPKTSAAGATTERHRLGNVRVEGIWVRAHRSGSGHQLNGIESEIEPATDRADADEDVDEQDEPIWWSWDGKLTGFTDW
ncbi:hypothetical protein EDC04DRAFT_2565001 [Pisolithus marmoratus]|nr:hypothetical protein EDC04DRAFT_2565001 [Pisolithus marmoratus]